MKETKLPKEEVYSHRIQNLILSKYVVIDGVSDGGGDGAPVRILL